MMFAGEFSEPSLFCAIVLYGAVGLKILPLTNKLGTAQQKN